MTNLVTATIVDAAFDWQGVYIEDELRYENHTASIEDATIHDDEAVDTIQNKHVDIQRLGRTSLPSSLDTLCQLDSFADTVEEKADWWEEKIPKIMNNQEQDYVMTDKASEVFGVANEEGRVLLAIFSKISVQDTQTPLGRDPIVELDHEHSESGVGPAAYTLIN